MILAAAVLVALAIAVFANRAVRNDPEWTVKISGGHETDGRDRGRPVNLVAGGLGVKPEVFREAFSRVHPAPPGQQPDPEEVRRNKEVLLGALSQYGISNDMLDSVSNYYRYRRERGEMWPVKQATATAIVARGVVTGFKITNPGGGYSSPPLITIVGHPEVRAEAVLAFSKDLSKNGSISAIKIVKK